MQSASMLPLFSLAVEGHNRLEQTEWIEDRLLEALSSRTSKHRQKPSFG
jgi:hypothetical protein